jgi:hypothetical protein
MKLGLGKRGKVVINDLGKNKETENTKIQSYNLSYCYLTLPFIKFPLAPVNFFN